MRIAAREHPARGGGVRGHDRDAENWGETRARGEETTRNSRRPAEGKKKKKVEKEAFQVKLLGAEQPRFRAMTRGGRAHGVQGTLLGSAARARRGLRGRRPPPLAAGAGPRGAARRWTSAQGRPGPRSARPSSPPRPFTPERRRRSRVCPAEGEGRARGGGGGVVVPLQRGLLCPCAEMTHGVPSRHARAQRTDTHKERGKYTAPSRRPQQLPGPPRPGPPRAAPTPRPRAPPPPHVAPKLGAGPLCKVHNSRPR